MTTKTYTADDRAAIMAQVTAERALLEQEILSDLTTIADKISAAQSAHLFIGGMPHYLLNLTAAIESYKLGVPKPVQTITV